VVWLVIVLILIVAFGPILWLMPSRKERRLAALRQRAYQRGMRVDLRRLPGRDIAPEDRVTAGGRALDTTREYAAYVMPLEARLRMLPGWRVRRGAQGSRAAPGWAFEPGRRPEHPGLDASLEALTPFLTGLPDDVAAVELEPLSLAAYWLEAPGTTPDRVDDLASRLTAAAEVLTALDARLKADSEPGTI
jgi:hypothetical protein